MTHEEFFSWLRSMQDDKRLTQDEVNTANDMLAIVDAERLKDWLISVNDWKENTVKTWQMSLSDNGINQIKQFESFVSKPYLDAVKVWTIGYGNTYYPDGRKVTAKDKPLTEKEAAKLKLDIINKDFAPAINLMLEHEIKSGKISQNMFDALVSLAYNIGTGAIAKSSVMKHLKNDNKLAAADAFLLWNKANHKVLRGLVNRRNAERKLFLS